MSNQDDPFASFGDKQNDRTILKPVPGGRHPRLGKTPFGAPPPEGGRGPPSDLSSLPPRKGLNPLESAASALLALLTRVKNMRIHSNPGELRRQVEEEIRAFESKAHDLGASPEKLYLARYVLCAALDEAVVNTPWGNTSEWTKQGLLVTFGYREAWGGEKFFALLDKQLQDAAGNWDLLEVMYICLALGFQGRYRLEDGGQSELEEQRERLFRAIRHQRGSFERELSPRWQGTVDRRNPLIRYVPLWVIGAVGSVLLLAIYLGFRFSLSGVSGPVVAQLNTLGAEDKVPHRSISRPLEPTMRLTRLLREEVQRKLIDLREAPRQATVIIRGEKGDSLFGSGSAAINPSYSDLLARLGNALNTLPGQIQVTGHTDNRRIHTVRFPSNWELSQARADAVMKALIPYISSPERLRAVGLADTRPIVNNDTPGNRALNRRVEVAIRW